MDLGNRDWLTFRWDGIARRLLETVPARIDAFRTLGRRSLPYSHMFMVNE